MARYAFRVDASLEIGSGHVMRCLTLANALQAQGVCCVFLCREHQGNLIEFLRQHGHEVLTLPLVAEEKETVEDEAVAPPSHEHWLGVDWRTDAQQTLQALAGEPVNFLIVDHYALDARWETAVRDICRKLMVIDDLADRSHECDLLLDQNLGRCNSDYKSLVPIGCHLLLGPTYSLLRAEFASMREYSLQRRADPSLKKILVTLGGVDKENYTTRVLQALDTAGLPLGCSVTVILGALSPYLFDVEAQAANMKIQTQVLKGVGNMAQLMADSDLAIGAAGSTSWERCCLGLPTLLLVLAANQENIAMELQENGAAELLELDSMASSIDDFFSSKEILLRLKEMTANSSKLVDGTGTSRVIECML